MVNESEDKQTSYTCPLSEIQINKCPVKTCMYHVEGLEHNCALHKSKDIDEYQLAEHKNYSIGAVNKEIRNKKESIIRINVLYKYSEYIKQFSNTYKSRLRIKILDREELDRYFKLSWLSNPIFSSDLDIFALTLSEKLYEKFKNENTEVKQIKMCQILNIRENKLKKAKKLVKYKLNPKPKR